MNQQNALNAAASLHVASMGPGIGQMYFTLWQQTARLHTLFDEYVSVFGESQEQYDLLNKAASSFFYLVDYAMWEQVLLSIARLTGPVATGRPPNQQFNITLRQLPPLVDAAIRVDVEQAVDAAVAASSFSKEPRNKWIAHLGVWAADALMLG